MQYLKIIFAKNLADLRKANNLRQVDVANILGISAVAYNGWEKGGDWIGKDSLPKLEKLALHYGVRPSRFFYDPEMNVLEAQGTWTNKPSPDEVAKKLDELSALLRG